MAIIDINGKEQRQQIINDIGLRAAAAAQGSQKMTNVQVKSVLLNGEDIGNLRDALLPLCGDDGRLNMYMFGDLKVIDEANKNDEPFAILLVGVDATSSSLGWNCGACGFKTCGEFNKYAKENKGRGTAQGGPSCMWQIFDLGGAVCSAAASVYESGLPTRVHTSFGSLGVACGYIDSVQTFGISIGPWKYGTWDEWYNRPRMKGTFNMEDIKTDMMRCYPTLFAGFNGRGRPLAKTDIDWQAKGIYFQAEYDEAYENKRKAAGAKFGQVAAEIRAKVAAKKEQKDK
ncbi:MAG TPA: DUF2148 domain-containing protein [Desulfobacteria bacterium]|nr:DUF2148 domain-containing protein [Desulfobacteria bacterium]